MLKLAQNCLHQSSLLQAASMALCIFWDYSSLFFWTMHAILFISHYLWIPAFYLGLGLITAKLCVLLLIQKIKGILLLRSKSSYKYVLAHHYHRREDNLQVTNKLESLFPNNPPIYCNHFCYFYPAFKEQDIKVSHRLWMSFARAFFWRTPCLLI